MQIHKTFYERHTHKFTPETKRNDEKVEIVAISINFMAQHKKIFSGFINSDRIHDRIRLHRQEKKL